MTQDKRSAKRIKFDSKVQIWCKRNTCLKGKVDSKNISLTGLYVETTERLDLEATCRVDINLIGASSEMICSIKGTICRHDDQGMGIVFTKLSPDNYLHIENLVRLHAAMEG